MPDPNSELDAAVHQLRARITAAQRARSRAEMERDAAQAQAARARQQLQDEFGVTTVDDARTVLADLRTRLREEITALQDALNQIDREAP